MDKVPGAVVKGILFNKACNQDKVAYMSKQTWLEAAGPLIACLEKVHEGTLSLPELSIVSSHLRRFCSDVVGFPPLFLYFPELELFCRLPPWPRLYLQG